MSTEGQEDGGSKHAKAGDKFKGYVAKPEVKNIYTAMKVSAKVLDGTNSAITFLAKPKVMGALTKNCPTLAESAKKAARLAKALGPAGVTLGIGVDLMVAAGLIEDATMNRLNEISCQIKQLRSDVKKGFESLKLHMKTMEARQRFLLVYDDMLTNVLRYEQILASPGDTDSFFKRVGSMVEDYSPNKIFVHLRRMHVLITGEAEFGKPLFEQFNEVMNELEGADADQFIATLLLQFQTVICLEMRAVRMLRAFIAYKGEDVAFSEDVKSVFKDIALQRTKHDPALKYEWYIKFMAFGGEVKVAMAKRPDLYWYMKSTPFYYDLHYGKGDHGDKGVFIVTPHCDGGGKYLISCKEWPDYYLYMKNFLDGRVMSHKGDPGPQGHWKFIIKDIPSRSGIFTLTQCEWPNCYVCARTVAQKIVQDYVVPGLGVLFLAPPLARIMIEGSGEFVGTKGSPDDGGQFELHIL